MPMRGKSWEMDTHTGTNMFPQGHSHYNYYTINELLMYYYTRNIFLYLSQVCKIP